MSTSKAENDGELVEESALDNKDEVSLKLYIGKVILIDIESRHLVFNWWNWFRYRVSQMVL